MSETDAHFFIEWNVSIKYESKLSCTEDKFISELESLWPVFNRNWNEFKDIKIDALYKFYSFIVDNYMISHPNVCEMLLILMAASPNTSPLERSYSKLAKICYKDRNRLMVSNLETLYLLAVHKIEDQHKKELFAAARALLEHSSSCEVINIDISGFKLLVGCVEGRSIWL